MDIAGSVIEITPTQQVSDRFSKRELVIQYIKDNPEYPELIKFECHQDRTELLDSFKVGQTVRVFFDLRGRKWDAPDGATKYFNTLVAWRIVESSESGQDAPDTQQPLPPETAEDWIPF